MQQLPEHYYRGPLGLTLSVNNCGRRYVCTVLLCGDHSAVIQYFRMELLHVDQVGMSY